MAKWAHATLLDNGPQVIVTRAATANRIVQHVIKAYTAGDSYATVTSTNSVGNVALAAADVPLSGAAGAARTMTVASKTGTNATANSGAGPNLHLAIVDTTTSEVLLVTDETTDQVITSGNPLTFPSWTYAVGQPT